MFKSKHSGWTWDLKRTPFGGGGGFSPLAWVEDTVSSAGNAIGNGINSIGDALAPVLEPIYQPIGSGVEQAGQGTKKAFEGIGPSTKGWDPHITEGTNDWLTENGWMIPLMMITYGAATAMGGGAIAAGEVAGEGAVAGSGGAIAADGTVFAAGEAIPAGTTMSSGSFAGAGASAGMVDASGNIIGAGSEGASMGAGANAAGQAAYDAAIANGASQATAQATADSVYNSYLMSAGQYTAAGGEAANLTPEMIAYANASADPIGSINAIAGMTPEEFASYTKIIGDAGSAAAFTAGEDLAQLMQSYPDLSQAQLEDILQINYGADPTVAADAANLARSGYDAATIDQVLGYSYTPTELAGTGIESSSLDAASSSGLSDTLKNINRARQFAKLLGTDQSKVNYKMPSSAEWLKNAQQVSLNMPAQQQFGGLYESNKNPFTFQNPLANALVNKDTSGLDVSGTQGTALNTKNQASTLAKLL